MTQPTFTEARAYLVERIDAFDRAARNYRDRAAASREQGADRLTRRFTQSALRATSNRMALEHVLHFMDTGTEPDALASRFEQSESIPEPGPSGGWF